MARVVQQNPYPHAIVQPVATYACDRLRVQVVDGLVLQSELVVNHARAQQLRITKAARIGHTFRTPRAPNTPKAGEEQVEHRGQLRGQERLCFALLGAMVFFTAFSQRVGQSSI